MVAVLHACYMVASGFKALEMAGSTQAYISMMSMGYWCSERT